MPSSFSQVIQSLKKFPGIGQKSAERIAFYFLETDPKEVQSFTRLLNQLIEKTVFCKKCGLISEQSPCRICSSSKRDHSLICVVKNIQDAIQIERSQSYQGIYHVLGGLLSPLSNIYEKDLKIEELLKRIAYSQPFIREIIFALEQSIEADTTIQLITEKIQEIKNQQNPNQFKQSKQDLSKISEIVFSRMAVGIPIGTGLEFIDKTTLKQSLNNRYSINKG